MFTNTPKDHADYMKSKAIAFNYIFPDPNHIIREMKCSEYITKKYTQDK